MLTRVVSREVLDDLPQDNPLAVQSRRDLQRVHAVMRTRSILVQALKRMPGLRQINAPLRILELGAGDGSLMLGVAQALKPQWARVHLTLLDAQALVTPNTVARYAKAGWTAVSCVQDVFEWANPPSRAIRNAKPAAHWDLIVANLFLHHFEEPRLTHLLRAIADRSNRFLACEPRRAWLPLLGSHLIGALGTNAVTREDAVLSVHAGFRNQDLTALWPDVGDKWVVQEYAAGLFSHCFCAHPLGAD